MTIVSPPNPQVRIDYDKIAEDYNTLVVDKSAIRIDRVYNITLFKQCLSRRGVICDVDFEAFSKGEFTYVKRLTEAQMTKE